MKKRILSLLVAVALILSFGGCGARNTSGSSAIAKGEAASGELTRAQWIGMLGNCFGYTEALEEKDYYPDVKSDNEFYNEIQACAEWGVMGESDSFEPDETATWDFAIETAVRAVGLDNINHSVTGVSVAEDSLVDFFTGNIANITVTDLNAAPTASEAAQILEYAYQYYMQLVPADVYEVTYLDSVREVAADAISLKGDGSTAIINDGASYEAGDVIYVQPSGQSGSYAVKVNSCNGNQITYELVGMEDVFEELVISGSQDITVIGAETANYVSVNRANSTQPAMYAVNTGRMLNRDRAVSPIPMQTGVDAKVNGDGVTFHANLDGIDFTVALTNFQAVTDVDFGIFKGLKKADAMISFDDRIEVNKDGAAHFARTIPLGSVKLQLGSTPLQAEVSLMVNIGIDGEITLTYTSNIVGKVQYSKGKGLVASVSNDNSTLDFHAQTTVAAEPTVKVDLQCLKRSIANVKVTSGVVAIATVDADLMGKLPECIDIYLYVPLRWAVNEDGCVMASISDKLRKSQTVWDSENSPITQRFHWEDLVLVDACTRDKNQAVETPVVSEEGIPYEEYHLFEFEEMVFGHIDVASTSIYLDKGETMTLGILEVPSGYSPSDLVYESQDSSICSASGGSVSGVESGSTVLKISTSDGKYSVYVTVVVAAQYHDTSGFQPL